jgi:hypothetical protein
MDNARTAFFQLALCLPHVGDVCLALTGSHSGPDFDKLISLIEEGAVPGIGIPSVRDCFDRFVGA